MNSVISIPNIYDKKDLLNVFAPVEDTLWWFFVKNVEQWYSFIRKPNMSSLK